ncbi:hypothetical protein CBR_g31997 [Chara braunii]|uniref:Glutamyl-tRNA(Gln) amidotransferase subunit C, chloroplastic/mitochondrial n=1 Tax=Chara braunii TaxID=69332 RepID=A0A388LGL0_CHABU|nr:hypothetical protein CBR_g31997 [Chara braunii]|eukprot:GBG81322.1 hypothetical protein CBR_g31997 [Chara braunii]
MTASLMSSVSLTRVFAGDSGRAFLQPSGLHVLSESTLVSAAALSRSSVSVSSRRDGVPAGAQGFSISSRGGEGREGGSRRRFSKQSNGMWRRAVCRTGSGTTAGSSLATWRSYVMGGTGAGVGGGRGGAEGEAGGRSSTTAAAAAAAANVSASAADLALMPNDRSFGTMRATSEAVAARGLPSDEGRQMADTDNNDTSASTLQPPDVADLANRARITVSPEEVLEWSPKIGRIVDWFGQLQKIDLEGVVPATRPAGVLNDGEDVILRADVATAFEERAAMIDEVPQMTGPYIKVPRILSE